MTNEAAAWVNGVLQQAPAAVAFDCDGTLWALDSGYGFMRWSQNEGLLSRQASEWMDERYRNYLAGAVSEAAICGEMVQVYTGLRDTELRQAAGRFVGQQVLPFVFPEMLELVAGLHRQGAEVWAVSSTCHWVVAAAVLEAFSIPANRVLAAQVRIVDDLATDRLLAVPTDAAKADALRRAGVPLPDAAFGNSIHDLAMLELSRRPCAVNPTPELDAHARLSSWPVYWPSGCLAPAPSVEARGKKP